jgi:hypothetical protein
VDRRHNWSAEDRRSCLRDLVELRVPLARARASLARFPFDSDDELLALNRIDAVRVLTRYLDGSLPSDDLRDWADALEARDDLGREQGVDDALTEFLFQLATPDLAGELTPDRAAAWIDAFQTPGRG